MIDLLLKFLPYIAGVLGLVFVGVKMGKNSAEKKVSEYKEQAETEIRSMSEKAAKAEAEATNAEKVARVAQVASQSVKEPQREVVSEATRESVLKAVEEMIKESKNR